MLPLLNVRPWTNGLARNCGCSFIPHHVWGANHANRKEKQPAFYHAYEYVRGQKLGVIRLNPVVADRLAKDPLRETLHPRHLPMLVKPKPWLAPDQGGYIYNTSRNISRLAGTVR